MKAIHDRIKPVQEESGNDYKESTNRYKLSPEEELALRANPPGILKSLESACVTTLSPRKFNDEVRLGKIPSAKIGSRRIFRLVDLQKYISEAIRTPEERKQL